MIGQCDNCGHYTKIEYYPLTASKQYFCKACCLKLKLKLKTAADAAKKVKL